MKVVNVVAQLFATFVFLTLGSMLIIVALHILSLNDAIIRVQELYESPWKSIQIAAIGFLFIAIGLIFAKMLLKTGKQDEAIIIQSEVGPMVVSSRAIEDVVKKVIKRFHLIKESKIKTVIQGKTVELKLRLVLWAGGTVPELLIEVQNQVRTRLNKLLGGEVKLEINCDVQRIEDHESDFPESQTA